MKDYKTDHLLIMNCSLDMAKSIILFRKELTVRSPIEIPDNWPSNRFKSFLPLLIEDFEKDRTSPFHMWILAELLQKQMIGDMLLYKMNNKVSAGFLEIYFMSNKEEKKFYKESLKLFLEYVMNHFKGSMKHVYIEVMYTDNFKVDVLKRLGFYLKKREHPYLLWSYSLPVIEGT
jgi:[ribosomal protein S5]-alanine N-acetyltransferase